MQKIIRAILTVFCILIGFQSCTKKGCEKAKSNPVAIDNKKCPVSGKAVNGVDTYTHHGKQVNLCSQKCTVPFSKDPESYVSKAEREMQDD